MRHDRANQRTTRTVAAVMAYLLSVAGACAAITRVAFATQARRLLRVHFTGVSHDAATAAGIWAHNTRIFIGFAVFLACAYFIQHDERSARIERTILRTCDGALLLWATGTAALAGVLAGAYGLAQIRAFLPQGPVELAAWALLIALYIHVRRQQVRAARAVRELAVIVLVLAASAVLELWLGA
ncbi:MAG: hypothetical protein ACRDK7_07020 [Solirubrobacteraceae bacterium]